jgi:expansin (peptidoglycan-binding protein)
MPGKGAKAMNRALVLIGSLVLLDVLAACGGEEGDEDADVDGTADPAADDAGLDPAVDDAAPDLAVDDVSDDPVVDGPVDPAADDAEGPVCDRTEHEGVATYYTFADGSGNCSFPPTPDDLNVAAMNNEEYAGSAVCGTCVFIQGPIGTVTVRIVDRCPECNVGHLDLSPSAFEQIARIEEGIVDITWHYVPCNVEGPIRYHFKEGSNQWWTAVQVRNHTNRVDLFEYLDGSGTYRQVPRLDYNFFVEESGMGPGPYTFRVSDQYGNVLEDSGIGFVEGGEVAGSGQFPACL